MTPKVFVVQENSKIDISPALKFGEIVTILPPGDTNFSYEFLAQKIGRTLRNRACVGDYLLLTGDPVAIGIASAVMAECMSPDSPIKFLKWLPRELRYIEVSVDLN